MKRIQVAAGVIRDESGKVLVAQRVVKDRYFQKWEFPGGKLEAGELPDQALVRELKEELGIDVSLSSPLITIQHDYPDRKVELFVREVTRYQGEPAGIEGQAVQWVDAEQLNQLDFLQANEPIICAARMPAYMLITQAEQYGVDFTLDKIDAWIHKGMTFIIQVRESTMSLKDLQAFIKKIKDRIVGTRVRILLNSDVETAISMGVDGAHLKSNMLQQLEGIRFDKLPKNFMLGASCHTRQDIELANQCVSYAVLGSVHKTNSHPDGQTLEWGGFESLVHHAKLPVFAVGGMGWQDKDIARGYGAQGVAMISAAWH